MKTTIYYFTGTGNSLSIAKGIAAELEDCELIFMANLRKQDEITATSEKVGFIFPMFFFGLPQIVHEFMEKINLDKVQYIFAGVNRHGTMDGVAFLQINNILSVKRKELNAGWFIQLPNSYIYGHEPDPEEEINQMLTQLKNQVKNIAKYIKEGKNSPPPPPKKRTSSIERTNNNFREGVFKMDDLFYSDESCTSCGICESICPVNNIVLVDGKPQWQQNCQQCFACLNYCPEESIQYGDKTQGRGRYQNPEITIQEMMNHIA
ncbi:MAG: 4Fe-4S ferredoxin [Promethearchaeota archaeon]|nr:MAG: 4Fe-4S ferredoxin [Candidatus Lokiarchaeota archaeon]